MTSAILQLDTRDDRLEIWSLLHRLHPRARAFYLFRCCKKAGGDAVEPGPDIWDEVRDAERCDRGDDRLTNNVYALIIAVANQYDGLDFAEVALELEQYAKKGELPPLPRPVTRRSRAGGRGATSPPASPRRPSSLHTP